MLNNAVPYRLALALKVLIPVLLLIAITSQVLAVSACKRVKGQFTLHQFTGPNCASPIGFCATSTFTGDLTGDSTFTGASMVPSTGTSTTGVIFITGEATILTNDGIVFTNDVISLNTTGKGEFAKVATVVGGTGKFTSSTGKFTVTGTYLDGNGLGTYNGSVCTP